MKNKLNHLNYDYDKYNNLCPSSSKNQAEKTKIIDIESFELPDFKKKMTYVVNTCNEWTVR